MEHEIKDKQNKEDKLYNSNFPNHELNSSRNSGNEKPYFYITEDSYSKALNADSLNKDSVPHFPDQEHPIYRYGNDIEKSLSEPVVDNIPELKYQVNEEKNLYHHFNLSNDEGSDFFVNNDEKFISIITHPSKYQLKGYRIIPSPVIRVLTRATYSDFILVFLICDQRMNLEPIFMEAHSAKLENNKRDIIFENIKLTSKMHKGRTKGYYFCLRFDYYSHLERIESLFSTAFHIWTNSSQKNFPKEERNRHIQNKWKVLPKETFKK